MSAYQEMSTIATRDTLEAGIGPTRAGLGGGGPSGAPDPDVVHAPPKERAVRPDAPACSRIGAW